MCFYNYLIQELLPLLSLSRKWLLFLILFFIDLAISNQTQKLRTFKLVSSLIKPITIWNQNHLFGLKIKICSLRNKKKPICLLIIYIYPIKFSRKQTFIEHVIGFSIQSKVYNGFPTNEPMANSICQKYTVHCIFMNILTKLIFQ